MSLSKPWLSLVLVACVQLERWLGLIVLASIALAVPAKGGSPEPLANWPSFRGTYAAGVADGQHLPLRWDVEAKVNVRWTTKVPGLSHSSPVVWGDRVYVTIAVSADRQATFKHGLYGNPDAADDRSRHDWQVLALAKASGEVLWRTTVHSGAPKDKRHIKATYANSTPATNGRYIVALFGSEGLYALDAEGKVLWRKDLGRLDAGSYNVASYEWGSASSPVIFENLVIVQCDSQSEDFVLAADLATGRTVWTKERDEVPSWGTPTIVPHLSRPQLVTNASHLIRSYDPRSGDELWRLAGNSMITAPTPIFSGNLIVVASGRRPEKPIFVVRADASGDISPGRDGSSGDAIVWSNTGRGPYMPTPIIYDGLLYSLNNNGVLDAYELATGQEVYRERLRHGGGGFSASPVAADGRLYLPGEDGEIYVVKTGREFELLATNRVGERLMSTPALSDGLLLVKAENHLFAIAETIAEANPDDD